MIRLLMISGPRFLSIVEICLQSVGGWVSTKVSVADQAEIGQVQHRSDDE